MNRFLLIACFFLVLTFISLLAYTLAENGMTDIDSSLKWIRDGREGKPVRYFKTYRKDFIHKTEVELVGEQYQLTQIRTMLQVIFFLVTLYVAGLIFYYRKNQPPFMHGPHKGSLLSVFCIVLIAGSMGTFSFFSGHFHQFPNANRTVAENVSVFLVFLAPVLFLMSTILGFRERKNGIGTWKWEPIASLLLFICSTIIALFVGLLLNAPDFGNFG